MKKMLYLGAVLAALMVVPAARADYVMSINSYSAGGSSGVGVISFNGAGNFQFLNTKVPGGTNFQVGLVTGTGVTGDASGLLGVMTGTYTIGSITTNGSLQTASVSTSAGAKFIIHDGVGNDFTANLNFSQIQTNGHSDALNNLVASMNLTGLSYSGPNNDLTKLAAYNGGSLTVTFDFANSATLTTLATDPSHAPYQTGFSGQLTAVPAPASWLLMSLGTGLVGLFNVVRRRRLRVA
jgi:hypothetical protein